MQFEPPYDLDVLDEVGAMGIDSVGIHIETFDPTVLARVAPGKARTGIEGYFAASCRVVSFGFVIVTTGVTVRSPLAVRRVVSTSPRSFASTTCTPFRPRTFLIPAEE